MAPPLTLDPSTCLQGTFAIAQTLADITENGAITIVGGGDSVAAVEQAGLGDQVQPLCSQRTGSASAVRLIAKAASQAKAQVSG